MRASTRRRLATCYLRERRQRFAASGGDGTKISAGDNNSVAVKMFV